MYSTGTFTYKNLKYVKSFMYLSFLINLQQKNYQINLNSDICVKPKNTPLPYINFPRKGMVYMLCWPVLPYIILVCMCTVHCTACSSCLKVSLVLKKNRSLQCKYIIHVYNETLKTWGLWVKTLTVPFSVNIIKKEKTR